MAYAPGPVETPSTDPVHPSGRAPRLRAALGAVLLACWALLVAGCGAGASEGAAFRPVASGTLTVATAYLPAPGFWNGTTASAGGFEADLATTLGHRLGLARVRVVKVPFARLAAGDLGGADVALSQVTPTEERDRTADFSIPYLTAPPGVLAAPRTSAHDVSDLRDLRWVVVPASTLTRVVRDVIRPHADPVEVTDRTSGVALLDLGAADAMLLDLPVALGVAGSSTRGLHVVGQLQSGEGLAAVLPEGSPNAEIVDSTLREMIADGTVGTLADRWLGGDGADVPLIRTEELP